MIKKMVYKRSLIKMNMLPIQIYLITKSILYQIV